MELVIQFQILDQTICHFAQIALGKGMNKSGGVTSYG